MTSVTVDVAAIIIASGTFVAQIWTAISNSRLVRKQNERIDNHAADIRTDIAAINDPAAKAVGDLTRTLDPPRGAPNAGA